MRPPPNTSKADRDRLWVTVSLEKSTGKKYLLFILCKAAFAKSSALDFFRINDRKLSIDTMQFKSTALLVSTLSSIFLHVIVLATNGRGFGNSVQVNRPSAVNVSLINLNTSKFEHKKTTHTKSSNLQSYNLALPKTIKQIEPLEQSKLQTANVKSDQFTNEITKTSEKILLKAIELQISSPAYTGESNSVLSDITGLVPTPLPVPLSMLLTWPANLKKDVSVRLESYWKDGKLELKMMESSGNPAFDAYAQAYAQYQLDNATTELAQQQYFFTLTR